MPITIQNRASVSYFSNGVPTSGLSNIATAQLLQPLTAAKYFVEQDYRADCRLACVLSIANGASGAISGIVLTDDLGTFNYTPEGSGDSISLTPLDFVGRALLFKNGVFDSELTPTATEGSVIFELGQLGAGAAATLIYNVQVNQFAPLAQGSMLTCTSMISASALSEQVTAQAILPVAQYADLAVFKSMSPDPVLDGGEINCAFTLSNSGNTEATGIVLTDQFSPPLDSISTVLIDGVPLGSDDYDYVGGTLTVPGSASELSLGISAAQFARDQNGKTDIVPGSMSITAGGVL